MKKFLVTLIVIILAVSVGFGVFYLVRDDEVISLKTASLFKDAGEKFEVSLDMKNSNSYTTIQVSTSDEAVVKLSDSKVNKKKGKATGSFEAVKGGNAKITFKTNNAKFRNITCDVVVSDGSKEFPFRIDTAEELQKIGTEPYTMDKNYVLSANIDLGTLDTEFIPLPGLIGTFDGAGFTISNLKVEKSSMSQIGLFQNITKTGVVKNLKFDGAVIATADNTSSAGVVAGVNNGTVKLIEVISATINNTKAEAYVGGIVGVNRSANTTAERQVARLDRVSINLTSGTAEVATKGFVGGITALNEGGVIINSYAKGEVFVKDAELFGGIVGQNKYSAIQDAGVYSYSGDLGGKVKDCYSIVKINDINLEKMGHIVANNTDLDSLNKFVGNYYVMGEDGLKGCGASDINYTDTQSGTKAISKDGLKDIATLVSYNYYEKKTVISGNKVIVSDDTSKTPKTHYWSLSVWTTDNQLNEGLPILTYKDEFIDDNFDNSGAGDLITSAEGLKGIVEDLSKTYYLNGVIDLSAEEWVPIGSEAVPFMGQLHFIDGAKITGLKITVKSYENAGLFGVLGSGAKVVNPVIENIKLTSNSTNAGAVAGTNNGRIEGAIISNGEIFANQSAGGIAGVNAGEASIVVASVKGDEGSSLTIKTLKSSSLAGGIVGSNLGNIGNELSNALVSGNVLITSADTSSLGGIAGSNAKVITNAKVSINRNNSFGVITSKVSKVGGIAGYNEGLISYSVVSATISTSDSEGSFAGGIAGDMMSSAKGNSIQVCVVKDSYISGYLAGGVVAHLNTMYTLTLDIKQNDWDFNGNVYLGNTPADIAISKVAVESNVTIGGDTTGGLVGKIVKGAVSDCYTKATLSGQNNAGLVYEITYTSSSGEGGVMFDVYSTASANGGNNYAVSSSEVHNSWSMTGFLTQGTSGRTAGVIYDYYYLSRDNMKNPTTPAPFKSENKGRSESQMKDSGLWSIFNAATWDITQGYPKLNDCAFLEQ